MGLLGPSEEERYPVGTKTVKVTVLPLANAQTATVDITPDRGDPTRLVLKEPGENWKKVLVDNRYGGRVKNATSKAGTVSVEYS